MKPHIGILSIHPAPYRDYIFSNLYQRNNFDFEVLLYYDKDYGHKEWNWTPPYYPHKKLNNPIRINDDLLYLDFVKYINHNYKAIIIPGYSRVTSMLALYYAIFKKIPFILTLDSIERNSDRNLLKEKYINYIFKNTSVFWVPGKASRKYLNSHGILNQYIFEGAYCFDADSLWLNIKSNCDKKNLLKRKFNIPENAYVFITIGKLTNPRNIIFLVDAFRQINQSKLSYLIIVGDGLQKKNILSLIKKHNVHNILLLNSIHFNQISDFLILSDTYIHPGVEPYSTSTEYAAIAGLPIISTDKTGYIQDLICRSANPFIFKSGDKQDLMNKMEFVLNNPTNAKIIGNKIHDVAIQRNINWATSELENAIYAAINNENIN